MSDLPRYTSWGAVLENLKTKTQLGAVGLKQAKGQGRAALKVNTFRHGERYDLCNVAQAVPKCPVTETQRGGLATGWETRRAARDLHAV